MFQSFHFVNKPLDFYLSLLIFTYLDSYLRPGFRDWNRLEVCVVKQLVGPIKL
jgi:hypothetical protein